MRDGFVWANERSCARYSAVCKSLGQPDPFRLRHKNTIADIVKDIVVGSKNKLQAAEYIRHEAPARVETDDMKRFIEVVETELISLHLGNIARYRLRPEQYQVWKETWQ